MSLPVVPLHRLREPSAPRPTLVPVNGQASATLHGWKEIARFTGRGVRTVQRWERIYGFPVHRPAARSRSAVFALAPEIEQWMKSAPATNGEPEVALLRRRVAELEKECALLRVSLASAQRAAPPTRAPSRPPRTEN
jgi:hypothetical protein